MDYVRELEKLSNEVGATLKINRTNDGSYISAELSLDGALVYLDIPKQGGIYYMFKRTVL